MRVLICVIAIATTLIGSTNAFGQTDLASATSRGSSDSAIDSSQVVLRGRVVDIARGAFSGAQLHVGLASTSSDENGVFQVAVVKGKNKLLVSARGYVPFALMLSVFSDTNVTISLSPAVQMTVDAKLDELPNDPTARVYRTEDLLPADPGLPGQPVVYSWISFRNCLWRSKSSTIFCIGRRW